jgi:hypothetical protein
LLLSVGGFKIKNRVAFDILDKILFKEDRHRQRQRHRQKNYKVEKL